MNGLEDQLTSAAEEARRQVAHVQTRPAAGVRARMYRHKAFAGAAVTVMVFGLLGGTAVLSNRKAPSSGFASTPSTNVPAKEPTTTTSVVAVATPAPEDGTAEATAAAPLRFDPHSADEPPWDWVDQIAAIRAGEGSWNDDFDGIRQKLAAVREAVPAIAAAHGLMYRSTEWYEDAFLLLGDGSDTMVYIGWNELESTDPVSAEAWNALAETGVDPVKIALPLIDESMQQGFSNDVLILDRYTDRAMDFVADTATVVATVRFFQLADSYATVPIEKTADQMGGVADEIFDALNLPKGEPGDLAPPPDIEKPPVDMATLVTGATAADTLPTVVMCAPDYPPVGDTTGDAAVYGSPIGALAGFLDEHRSGADFLPLARSGYQELHLPNGSIAFANPFEGDPTLAVTWVTVDRTTDGWIVTGWKSAGC